MMKQILLAITVTAALLSLSNARGDTHEHEQAVHVTGAWARASLVASRPIAAYLTLHYAGDGLSTENGMKLPPLVLTGASTPIAGRVELHEMTTENGVAKMRPLERTEIRPGASLVLEPRGRHFMIFELARKMKPGDVFPLTLHFANRAALTVDITVAPLGGGAPGNAHDHRH